MIAKNKDGRILSPRKVDTMGLLVYKFHVDMLKCWLKFFADAAE